jgi:hypothetical protein
MRIAKCHCGEVEITCHSEPNPVVMCSCELCQRRTGSLFNIAAWFEKNSVEISGNTVEYTRTTGDTGLPFTFNFCPKCGTSVWWLSAQPSGPLKDKIGIAGGCFAASDLPPPTLSIYEKHMHSWVSPPDTAKRYDAGLSV